MDGALIRSNTVRFKLPEFEGPLDLLLFLIGKNKVSIMDIPIALILEQYMAYLDEMKRFDIEIASEFVATAAQLLLIKSRMLLPRYDDEAEEDPREQLVAMLLEYQRFKDMTEFMRLRSDLGLDTYVKEPEIYERDERYGYEHAPRELASALSDILRQKQYKLPPVQSSFTGIVHREQAPVNLCVERIISILREHGKRRLKQIFLSARSRSELVGFFLAVLELCRESRVCYDETDESLTLHSGTDDNWYKGIGVTDEPEGSGINH